MGKEVPLDRSVEERIAYSLETVLNKLDSLSAVIILGGSVAWGGVSSSSDIDLDVVCKSVHFLKFPFVSNLAMEKIGDLFDDSNIDMFKFKTLEEGTAVSIDFFPESAFDKVVNLDYTHAPLSFSLKCFREKTPRRSFYGPQHNFAGDPYYFPVHVRSCSQGFISSQDIIMIGKSGEFVMGSALDKLLVFSRIFGTNSGEIGESINHIISKLEARKEIDEKVLDRPTSFAWKDII